MIKYANALVINDHEQKMNTQRFSDAHDDGPISFDRKQKYFYLKAIYSLGDSLRQEDCGWWFYEQQHCYLFSFVLFHAVIVISSYYKYKIIILVFIAL